jgi:FkbM family methyltransferase
MDMRVLINGLVLLLVHCAFTQASRQQHSLLQVKKTGLTQSCPLPEGAAWAEVRLVDLPPFNMAVRTGNDPLSETLLQGEGHWEVEDPRIWGSPGEALDIGGNIGYYTFALAHSGWNVTTFEPMDRNLALLKATLCENPDIAARVKLLEFGLGTKNQQCSMIALPSNEGNGCVRCEGDKNKGASLAQPWDEDSYVSAGLDFHIRRLDEVLPEEGISKVDFVKLDVEGYECEVFKGAGDFLEVYKPRLVKSEVWQSMERCNSTEYFNLFENAGYRFGWDDDPMCSKLEVTWGDKDWGGNFYMCH